MVITNKKSYSIFLFLDASLFEVIWKMTNSHTLSCPTETISLNKWQLYEKKTNQFYSARTNGVNSHKVEYIRVSYESQALR